MKSLRKSSSLRIRKSKLGGERDMAGMDRLDGSVRPKDKGRSGSCRMETLLPKLKPQELPWGHWAKKGRRERSL